MSEDVEYDIAVALAEPDRPLSQALDDENGDSMDESSPVAWGERLIAQGYLSIEHRPG